jgi:hypothetical protein
MEQDKERLPGVNPQTFYIELDKDWQQGKYVLGYDPYEKEDNPINFYHKIRKFLGLSFKSFETNSKAVIYKLKSDGTIEQIK